MFLAAVGDARPLGTRDRVPVPRPPARPVRVVELPPEVKLTVEGDAQHYAARAPGVSRAQLVELCAGKVRMERVLDLHGLTIDAGLAQLRDTALASQRSGARHVLVVHGKGTHSEVGAPLREAVIAELLGPLSGLIHALATASLADGGAGATYLVLRAPR